MGVLNQIQVRMPIAAPIAGHHALHGCDLNNAWQRVELVASLWLTHEYSALEFAGLEVLRRRETVGTEQLWERRPRVGVVLVETPQDRRNLGAEFLAGAAGKEFPA